MRISILSLIFIFTLNIYVSAQDTSALLDSARMAKWTEDWQRAIENYEYILALDPENTEAQESIEEIKEKIAPVIEIDVASYADAGKFHQQTEGIFYGFYPRASTQLKIGYYHTYFSQKPESIDRNSYSFRLSHRLLPKVCVGAGYVFNEVRELEDNHAYLADIYFQAHPKTGLYLRYNHQKIIDTFEPFGIYGYNIINDIDAAIANISTDDILFAVTQKINERLSFLGSFNYGDYSDGNAKQNTFCQLDYILLNTEPKVHLKYQYFLNDYSDSSSLYWTPDNFDGHTILASFEKKLSQNTKLYAESAVSYLADVEKVGIMELLELDFQLNKDWSLKLNGFYSRSPREGQTSFWGRNFSGKLSCKF